LTHVVGFQFFCDNANNSQVSFKHQANKHDLTSNDFKLLVLYIERTID